LPRRHPPQAQEAEKELRGAREERGGFRLSRRAYALAAAAVFAAELFIALCVHDSIVRPYVGDSLAVVLVYLALRAVTRLRVAAAAAAAFAVGVVVELGQLVGILAILRLEHSPVARMLLGTDFEAADFGAYAAGALAAIGGEAWLRRWRTRQRGRPDRR
jgi:hypothetical protein